MNYIVLIIRLVLAAIFFLAAISKFSDQNDFRLYLAAHSFIPVPLVPLLAATVPAIELSFATSLIHTPRWNSLRWMLLGAMMFFTIYQITYALKGVEWGFPPDGACKCMKLPEAAGLSAVSPVIRNLVFLALAAVYFGLSGRATYIGIGESESRA